MSANAYLATHHLLFVVTGAGLLVAAISLPLIARWVPRNSIYGVRTRLAFSSDENWYRVNATGGKMLLRAGLAIMLVGAAGFLLPASWLTAYTSAALVLTVVFTLAAAGSCLRIR